MRHGEFAASKSAGQVDSNESLKIIDSCIVNRSCRRMLTDIVDHAIESTEMLSRVVNGSLQSRRVGYVTRFKYGSPRPACVEFRSQTSPGGGVEVQNCDRTALAAERSRT